MPETIKENELTPEQERIAALEAELAETKSSREQAERENAERIARIEGRLEEQTRSTRESGVQWPTTEEGWAHALDAAKLRYEADPERWQASWDAVLRQHQNFQTEQHTRSREQERALDRFTIKLEGMGFDEESDEFKLAMSAYEGGSEPDYIIRTYLDPIRQAKVEEANQDAENDTAEEVTRRTAIEGGEERTAPPGTEDGELEDTPEIGITRSVAELMKKGQSGSRALYKE
jgi:hypothetical protein